MAVNNISYSMLICAYLILSLCSGLNYTASPNVSQQTSGKRKRKVSYSLQDNGKLQKTTDSEHSEHVDESSKYDDSKAGPSKAGKL